MKGMRSASRVVLEDIPKHITNRRPSTAVRAMLLWSRISDFTHSQNWKWKNKCVRLLQKLTMLGYLTLIPMQNNLVPLGKYDRNMIEESVFIAKYKQRR